MSETTLSALTSAISRSATLKILVLGVLALGMLVPVALILGLVHEREQRLHTVEQEIATTWGDEQLVTGPVLSIPYRRRVDEGNESATSATKKQWVRGEAIYLPEELEIEADLDPEIRQRGIFSAVVYLADIAVEGSFRLPNPDAPGLGDAEILWDEAKLLVTLSDVHGLAQPVELDWPDGAQDFEPTRRGSLPGVALAAVVDGLDTHRPTEPLPFTMKMALRGSGGLQFTPAAKSTRIQARSTWPDPGFAGGFLPVERSVSEAGFTAAWHVSSVARSFPQQWLDADRASLRQSVEASGVGVRLTQPADAYQQTERAAKYGILFITLTFATFLLCELTSSRRLHPIQYLLVGSAMVVFYLLLLSLTEHFEFWISYLAAAAATVLLVAGYAWAILASRRLALALLAWMGVLYGYLYVLLKLEDYALLAGSLGLFALLAAFMWLTRRLDWSRLEFRPAS